MVPNLENMVDEVVDRIQVVGDFGELSNFEVSNYLGRLICQVLELSQVHVIMNIEIRQIPTDISIVFAFISPIISSVKCQPMI